MLSFHSNISNKNPASFYAPPAENNTTTPIAMNIQYFWKKDFCGAALFFSAKISFVRSGLKIQTIGHNEYVKDHGGYQLTYFLPSCTLAILPFDLNFVPSATFFFGVLLHDTIGVL